MSTSSDTYLDFSIYHGTIAAFNPTGFVAALMAGLGVSEISHDFAANPIAQHLYTGSGGFPLGTLDDGPGLYSPLPEFNFAYNLDTQILFDAPTLWAQIKVDLHFAAVPEPSSLALAFGAMICLGAFQIRRGARQRR